MIHDELLRPDEFPTILVSSDTGWNDADSEKASAMNGYES